MSGWIIRALLLTIVFRALIPIGFMPDIDAKTHTVSIKICPGHMAKSAPAGPQMPGPLPQSKKPGDVTVCAFSGVLNLLLALHQPLAAPVEFSPPSKIVVPRLTFVVPPARAGPVLGSRGPPSHS